MLFTFSHNDEKKNWKKNDNFKNFLLEEIFVKIFLKYEPIGNNISLKIKNLNFFVIWKSYVQMKCMKVKVLLLNFLTW